MKSYNHKVIKGSAVRGDQLRLPRAKSIYNSISVANDCDLVGCRKQANGSEVILFTIRRIGVPDEPAYDIHDTEEVAVICDKKDVMMPEVYALRKDFPVALPHSNAKEFLRPVSLCISDVPFLDIRHQFSAFDFIGYIRRWFLLNGMNKLHEADRPIEVFFAARMTCELKLDSKRHCNYALLTHKTKTSYTVEYVEKNKASHFIIGICLDSVVTRNFASLPETVADLASLKYANGVELHHAILNQYLSAVSNDNNLPLLVLLYVEQKKEGHPTENRIDLFVIKFEQQIKSLKSKLKRLSKDSFDKWFRSLKIDILFTFPQPLISLNRDSNRITHNVDKIAFIGTGTLGSNIVDNILREGFCEKAVLIDYDIYFPHNTARHILPIKSTMEYKATAMKNYLEGINNQKIDVLLEDFFSLNTHQKEMAFSDASIIVDASTSVAVERSLAHENRQGKSRNCTIFLSPKGTDLVLLFEDSEAKNRLDLLEMSYLRAVLVTSSLSFHLDMSDMVRTNDFSCRSESSVINYDNVKMLSAIASQQIKRHASCDDAFVGIWHVDEAESTVTKTAPAVQTWETFEVNTIHVLLAKDLKEEILSIVQLKGDCETGGCLLGCYDKDRKYIYVIYQIYEPKDSKCYPCSFVRGCDGLTDSIDIIRLKSGNQVRYLGEWHSHPNGSFSPSITDKEQFKAMSGQLGREDVPFVQMIYANNSIYVNAII